MKRKEGPLASEDRAATVARAEVAYARQMVQDLRDIVSTTNGRRIMGRLIFDVCGVMYGPPWTPSADIHRIAGRREVGLDLLAKLEDHAPHETRQMVNEWFSERNDRRIAESRGLTVMKENDE